MGTVLDIMCYSVDTVLDILCYDVKTVLGIMCSKVYTVLDTLCYNVKTVLDITVYNVKTVLDILCYNVDTVLNITCYKIDTVLDIMCYNVYTVLDITVYNVDTVFGYYGLQYYRIGYKLGKFLCSPCMFCHPMLWITAAPCNHGFHRSLCMGVIALFPSRHLMLQSPRNVSLWSVRIKTTKVVKLKVVVYENR